MQFIREQPEIHFIISILFSATNSIRMYVGMFLFMKNSILFIKTRQSFYFGLAFFDLEVNVSTYNKRFYLPIREKGRERDLITQRFQEKFFDSIIF